MVAQQLYRVAQADTDAAGATTFTFEPVPQGLAWAGSLRVAEAPYTATMVAKVGIDDWGQWQGPLYNGPVRVDSNQTLVIVATNLTPNTHYLATWLGVSDNADMLGPVQPTPASPTAFGFQATQILSPFDQSTQPVGAPPYISPTFPVSNVKGIRVGIVNSANSAGNPPTIFKFIWTAPDTTVCGVRTVIVAQGDGNLTGVAAFTHPNLGDFLRIEATTADGSNLRSALTVSLVDNDRLTWSRIESISSTGGVPDRILQCEPTLIVPGPTTPIAAGGQTYAGPATWLISPGTTATWQSWIEAQDEGGTWNMIARADQTTVVPSALVIVPPCPLRVTFANLGAGNTNVRTSLIGDAWR